jgi:replicative DNA helicase
VTDQPAQDLRAEQSILGAILHNPAVFANLGRLRADHFYHPQNSLLFTLLQGMHTAGEDIDSVTVFAELRKRGELRKVGAPYLSDLLQAFKTVANVGTYAQIVIDQWKLRTINQLGERFKQIHNSVDDIPEALEVARRFLDEVDGAESDDDFDSAYQSWMDWYSTDTVVIPTPWPGINNICLGGFHRGRVYTVTGRPGSGKSNFCLNAILHAARCGYRSVVYSLEMSSSECLSRILAAGANVPLKNIFQHRLTVEESKRISDFSDEPWRNLMNINDSPSQTIHTIMVDARARRNRGGLDLIAIDHSLLLDPTDRNLSEIQHINSVARGAKLLSRRLDCAVLLLHQMNREKEGRENRKPQMRDLYGGGEKDADIILALDRDQDHIIAYPLKSRMGPTKTAATLIDELAYGRLG